MKHLQNLGKTLSKQEQQSINGGNEGEIDKCCIRIPGGPPGPWCNPRPECEGSRCWCGNE